MEENIYKGLLELIYMGEIDLFWGKILFFWGKLKYEVFRISTIPRFNWKIVAKLTLNQQNYNNTLKNFRDKTLGRRRRLGRQISDKPNSLVRCQIQPILIQLLELSFQYLSNDMRLDLQLWKLEATFSRFKALSPKFLTAIGYLEGRFWTNITPSLDVGLYKIMPMSELPFQ